VSFVNPQLFFILIVPLLGFAFFIIRHQDSVTNLFSKEVLARLSVGDDALPIVVRNVLLLSALFLMLIALSRPVVDHGDRVVQLTGLSAVVALDISGSMRAKDIYPNRLEFAKKKMERLLDAMPNDELSLVAFGHTSFMLAPFSSDKAILKEIVEGVSDQYINMSSTNFTNLGTYVSELLVHKEPKILIVFTDGGDLNEIKKFTQTVKEHRIFLYVVLVGTAEGSPVLKRDGTLLHYKGEIAMTKRNDALGEVAKQSGGTFMVANTGTGDIEQLVSTIKTNHKSKKSGEVTIHDREEYFYYPLVLGILLLLLSFISLPSKKNSQKRRG